VDTAEDDHGKGAFMMTTGRRQTPAAEYPVLGAVAAKALTPDSSALPGHIQIAPWGGGGRNADSAYLGPKYSSITLGNGNPPPNTDRMGHLTPDTFADRQTMRRRLDERFLQRRRTAYTDAYTSNYEQALQLMNQKHVFDVSRESHRDHTRYGKHDIGRHCLLARRLIEHGIPYVQVNHSNYDTHNENFDFHLEQIGEFDRPFATLVEDLADRGLLEHTLVIVLSEFGRTPNINLYAGRDHWSHAWSVLVGGCGIKPGAVYGKTNELGTEVVEGKVDHAQLFHTYLTAVGLESDDVFDVDGREMPLAEPGKKPIKEILA
jgi:arylsulfatase A-like enzyme